MKVIIKARNCEGTIEITEEDRKALAWDLAYEEPTADDSFIVDYIVGFIRSDLDNICESFSYRIGKEDSDYI